MKGQIRTLWQGTGRPETSGSLLGLLLAVALVKLGNPVILDSLISRPTDFATWLYGPWPIAWGQALWVLTAVVALAITRKVRLGIPDWLAAVSLSWFAWQVVATLLSIHPDTSVSVLIHYGTVVGSFFVGSLVLANRPGFWLALLAGFVWVLWMGFDQHYGGLEATRRMVYEQGGWAGLPEDYLKRLAGNRVFSTLFYANTLAGVVLLLLPALVVVSWQLWPERLRLAKAVSAGLLGYGGVACLVWSGSKAGWLIAVIMAAFAAIELIRRPGLKVGVVILALGVGAAGFGLRFEDYLRRGATSAVARFEYWRVAVQVTAEHPMAGTGPGTFASVYRERKRAGAEMTRLVHNDYLQQGSDSGLPGFGLFAVWVVGGMAWAYRYRKLSAVHFAVWIGLVGWAVQGAFEFGMFIPATAWPAMMLLGWLAGQEQSDRQGPDALLPSQHR